MGSGPKLGPDPTSDEHHGGRCSSEAGNSQSWRVRPQSDHCARGVVKIKRCRVATFLIDPYVREDDDGDEEATSIDLLNFGLCPHGARDDDGCGINNCPGGPDGWDSEVDW